MRITHWVNALVLLVLLMSGLQIFNAHPALYLGRKSDFDDPILAMGAVDDGGAEGRHHDLRLRSHAPACRLSGDADSGYVSRGFPWWATLPGYRNLAMGGAGTSSSPGCSRSTGSPTWPVEPGKRASRRDLLRLAHELRPHIWRLHPRARAAHFPKGEEAQRYNVLQKLAYLAVVIVLLPLMLLTGLAMSPGMDAAWPWLLDLFGGRQTARTIHFIAARLVLFVVVHLVMVVLAGPFNEIRSMITGRYRRPAEETMMSRARRRRGFRRAPALAAAARRSSAAARSCPTRLGSSALEASGLTYPRPAADRPRDARARICEAEISPDFRANGNTEPTIDGLWAPCRERLRRLAAHGRRPRRGAARAVARRAARHAVAHQITRHDCVEGWSAIGKWTGVPLGQLLERARLKPDARYIVFHCADDLPNRHRADRYYESIDLVDAFHPQTILAYEMNGRRAAHRPRRAAAAPRRAAARLQDGQIRDADRGGRGLAGIGGGRGGFWEDHGYEWYAGI